jgi:antitoxin MazE
VTLRGGHLRSLGPCDYIVITMKARLVRIGNSRGVRLPKAVIDQVGLDDEVELSVEDNRVVITASSPPRSGWAEAARRLGAESSGLLNPASPTRFDEDEWQW